MSKTILISGGTGYIGSHTALFTIEMKKYNIIIVDEKPFPKHILEKFFTSKKEDKQFIKFYKCKIDTSEESSKTLDKIFTENKVDAVMNFAGSIVVPESVTNPVKYYENNFIATFVLLGKMKKHSVKYFIFSSTAAIFGIPEKTLDDNGKDYYKIKPNDKTQPMNPYGESKLMVEMMMKSYAIAYPDEFKFVSLRYFNACGAHESGEIGEMHEPETHLIPIVLHVALGKRENVNILGTDYETKDGTCVRDYIHVNDLASAHVLAVEHLFKGGDSKCLNLGSGKGYSVLEVVESCRKVTQHKIPALKSKRRLGDPPCLVASSEETEKVLGWKRKFDSLDKIISSQWNFFQKNKK